MKKASFRIDLFLLQILVLAHPTPAEGAVQVIELNIAPDPSPIVQTAYNAGQRFIYAGTDRSLYRFRRDGNPGPTRVVLPDPNVRLALPAGGDLYVRIIPDAQVGIFSANIKSIEDQASVAVNLGSPASGLILGTDGKLLVTRTALDNPKARHVQERYTFLAADGTVRREHDLPGPRQWEIDPGGEAMLLLGRMNAQAYSGAGDMVWTRDGAFRHGALGPGGRTALLNPAPREKIRQLLVRKASGAFESITLENPVAHLRIAPDESIGLVVLADERYVFINLATLEPSPPRTLPVQDVRLISDVEFIDPQTLVFGVIHRTPQPPGEERTVIALSSGAQQSILFTRRLPARSETAGLPAIDAAAGSRAFIARTDQLSIFVGLDN